MGVRMRPIMPKIRTGDVLLGTRNLRKWLTASFLHTLIRNGPSPVKYDPQKDMEWTVCVNTPHRFIVFSPEEIYVGFVKNGVDVPALESLTPSNFPYWFIRTDRKNPDMLQWPQHAYEMWACWQMIGETANKPIPNDTGVFQFYLKDQPTLYGKDKSKVQALALHGLSGFPGLQKAALRKGTRFLGPSCGEEKDVMLAVADQMKYPQGEKILRLLNKGTYGPGPIPGWALAYLERLLKESKEEKA